MSRASKVEKTEAENDNPPPQSSRGRDKWIDDIRDSISYSNSYSQGVSKFYSDTLKNDARAFQNNSSNSGEPLAYAGSHMLATAKTIEKEGLAGDVAKQLKVNGDASVWTNRNGQVESLVFGDPLSGTHLDLANKTVDGKNASSLSADTNDKAFNSAMIHNLFPRNTNPYDKELANFQASALKTDVDAYQHNLAANAETLGVAGLQALAELNRIKGQGSLNDVSKALQEKGDAAIWRDKDGQPEFIVFGDPVKGTHINLHDMTVDGASAKDLRAQAIIQQDRAGMGWANGDEIRTHGLRED